MESTLKIETSTNSTHAKRTANSNNSIILPFTNVVLQILAEHREASLGVEELLVRTWLPRPWQPPDDTFAAARRGSYSMQGELEQNWELEAVLLWNQN